MITQLRCKAQVTIPKDIIRKLGLKSGDNIDISLEDNRIVIKPVLIIDKEQAWFWSKEWQKDEKEVNEDIKTGRVKSFDSVNELIADLNDQN